MPREIEASDEYSKALLKNIPSEVIGPYLAIVSFMAAAPDNVKAVLSWVSFVVFLGITPVWMIWGQGVKKWWQVLFASLSFVIWTMTLVDGPFQTIPGYSTFVGGLLLLLFSGAVFPAISMLINKISSR